MDSTDSRSAQASQASTSASGSPRRATARSRTSSSTPSARGSSWHGWTTASLSALPSSVTSGPSTPGDFVARWTSYTEASRASRGAPPTKTAADPATSGTSGRRSPGSSESACPRWCFFENVAGLLDVHEDGDGVSDVGAAEVIGDLVGLGYRVAAGIVAARELGATHERKRVFIVAHANAHADADAQLREPDADGNDRGHAGADDRWREDRGAAALGYPRPSPPAPEDPTWREVVAADPALAPLVDGRRGAEFTEWLMGFPRGWTEGLGKRQARLGALGNAVYPAAVALAWTELSAAVRGAREPAPQLLQGD